MIKELRKNCEETGVTFFDVGSGKQGIVHVVGPEQGLTQPGMTIACGDSYIHSWGFRCDRIWRRYKSGSRPLSDSDACSFAT